MIRRVAETQFLATTGFLAIKIDKSFRRYIVKIIQNVNRLLLGQVQCSSFCISATNLAQYDILDNLNRFQL